MGSANPFSTRRRSFVSRWPPWPTPAASMNCRLFATPAAPFGGMAALVLALCDYDTPLWLDAPLAMAPHVSTYLRFHTGAPIVTQPPASAFALVTDCPAMQDWTLSRSARSPILNESTTLLIEVERLTSQSGLCLQGPGINSSLELDGGEALGGLAPALQRNHRLFPRGIDLFLVAGRKLAGLPRSNSHRRLKRVRCRQRRRKSDRAGPSASRRTKAWRPAG